MIKQEKVLLDLTFLSALTTVMLAHVKQGRSLYLPRKRVGYQEWLSLAVPPSILNLNLVFGRVTKLATESKFNNGSY